MQVVMVGPDESLVTRTLLDLGRDDYLVSDTDFTRWHLTTNEHDIAVAVHPDDALLDNYG